MTPSVAALGDTSASDATVGDGLGILTCKLFSHIPEPGGNMPLLSVKCGALTFL